MGPKSLFTGLATRARALNMQNLNISYTIHLLHTSLHWVGNCKKKFRQFSTPLIFDPVDELADALENLPEKASDDAAAANDHNLREVEIAPIGSP